ncbi:MAG: tRNA (N(6)-L-threonylcarbamoyladenosine(37)-C(2))-methylthiotransferase MtaB [Actinomycetota bacterium]|nr:tRNA (N(6)-L-threonylcarbamoyladenosine(37)-C(2))-methylthiotransferase MtaB [Actinomycetota bacterium]
MPTVAFSTLGCRLNQAESDSMAEQLAGHGFDAANPGTDPDVLVINTCTVTREATKGSRMAIRRAVRDHPNAKIVVVGCYAVSDPEEIAAIDGVDLIAGNDAKERIVTTFRASPSTAPLLQIPSLKPRAGAVSRVRANLKAQTGCDEFCTFCIIPTTRGPLRSMEAHSLVDEARMRVAAGARELVLTGVHLGKFGYDQGGDEKNLIDLFRRLLDVPGVLRLRLSSILSQHLTDDVLSYLSEESRICRYLHVPLQSGDDSVLTAMNRPYDIEGYLDAVRRAREALPGVALATDIIVGFPGETEEAFENTMAVVREVRFSKLHVFRYSPREGTPAAAMADEVPPAVKKDRSKRLIDLGNSIRQRWLSQHLGRSLEVLVEDERVIEDASICSGQTDDYVRVWFEGAGLLGKLVVVEGHEIRSDGIRGATFVTEVPA